MLNEKLKHLADFQISKYIAVFEAKVLDFIDKLLQRASSHTMKHLKLSRHTRLRFCPDHITLHSAQNMTADRERHQPWHHDYTELQ